MGKNHRTKTPAIQRFVRKVTVPQDPAQCWVWTGAIKPLGYGAFAPDSTRPRSMPAHRWLYQHVHGGTLPTRVFVCHTCDNPPCVNPAHLYAGSPADNMRDKVERNRHPRGVKSANAKLTEEDVRAIRRSNLSNPQLARLYPVTAQNIRHIRQRRTWHHI